MSSDNIARHAHSVPDLGHVSQRVILEMQNEANDKAGSTTDPKTGASNGATSAFTAISPSSTPSPVSGRTLSNPSNSPPSVFSLASSPVSSPSATPLSLNDVFTLEQNQSQHKQTAGATRKERMSGMQSDYSETADEKHSDLSVLHRFRMALRDVGSHTNDAESFIDALRHEFLGDWASSGPGSPSRQRPEGYERKDVDARKKSFRSSLSKDSNTSVHSEGNNEENGTGKREESKEHTTHPTALKEEDLRTRVQHILKSSNISHFDIEEIFETIDQDGSGKEIKRGVCCRCCCCCRGLVVGTLPLIVVVVDPFLSSVCFYIAGTLEWEEFLSFLSLSPASLRLVITRLQSTLKRDLNVKYKKNVQSLFDTLTTGSKIFEYKHLGKRRVLLLFTSAFFFSRD